MGYGYRRSYSLYAKRKYMRRPRNSYISRRRPRKRLRTIIKQTVNSMSETKVTGTTGGPTSFAATWTSVYLDGIAQGTDFYQRVGNKIFLKGIRLNMSIAGGFNSPEKVRIVLYWDKTDNGTSNWNTSFVRPVIDYEYADDGKVLFDRTYNLNDYNNGTGQKKSLKRWIQLNKEFLFDGPGVNDQSETNRLLFAFITDKTSGFGSIAEYNQVLYYKDI